MVRAIAFVLLLILPAPALLRANPGHSRSDSARSIVQGAIQYHRSSAAVFTMKMTLHRSGWERTLQIRAWSKGQRDSICFITAPPKDVGNGTLIRNRTMWTYNPRVNRAIRVPSSMMSQAWMGSDFTHEDLIKSDLIVEDYEHIYEGTEVREGLEVHVIRCLPRPGASVVWGMQRLKIREDNLLLEVAFYDEEMKPVKVLTGSRVRPADGRLMPTFWRMQNADEPQEYTLLEYLEVDFDADLPDSIFTVSTLSNPPR